MTGQPIRVLHVDDDAALLDIAATFIERADDRLEVTTTTDPQGVLDRLEDQPSVDCVVSDYSMPEVDGLELLRRVRATHPELPFVLFTGTRSDDVAADALDAGATDVCRKQSGTGHYRVLAHRVRLAVERRRECAHLEERCARLRSALSAAATELDDAVEDADDGLTALAEADATDERVTSVQEAHARLRVLAAELRTLEDGAFTRSSTSVPSLADD